jgi:hypothetical protein
MYRQKVISRKFFFKLVFCWRLCLGLCSSFSKKKSNSLYPNAHGAANAVINTCQQFFLGLRYICNLSRPLARLIGSGFKKGCIILFLDEFSCCLMERGGAAGMSCTNPVFWEFLFYSVGVQDPYAFGPPGSASGSFSHKYGSGSGSRSFHRQAKIVRKTSISSVFVTSLIFFFEE